MNHKPSYIKNSLVLLVLLFGTILPLQATVTQDAKILALDGAAGDKFGISVSISGNLAIVGSYLDDDAGNNSGSAYIYARTSGNLWVQQAKLVASGAAAGDSFGISVSISGNLAVVGSSGDADAGVGSGSAYIYANTIGNTWVQQAKLVATDAAEYDEFGVSVSISGNLAIVGSYQDGDAGVGSGSAYIYANTTGNTWVQQAKVVAADAAAYDYFGYAVSISGNLAIVGSYLDDDAGSSSGSAYVYANTIGNTWVQQSKLVASDAATSDLFGFSVSISGNLAIVGSASDDDAGSASGSAYVYANTIGNTWVQQAKIVASDASAGDGFGVSVSISGNLAIVGSYFDDDAGSNSGSAYVYANTMGSTWVQQAKMVASDASAGDGFGASVSISGSIAIMGSALDDDAGSKSGSSTIFRVAASNTGPSASLTTTDNSATEASTTTGVFTLALSENVTSDTNINLTLTGDASTVDGTDYTLSGANVTWTGGSSVVVLIASGTNSSIITLTPVDDSLVEGSELATLTLATGTGYTHSSGTGTITIADNDSPVATMSSSDSSAAEAATATGSVTITLDQTPVVTTTTINVVVTGTASTGNGTDYNLSGTGLTWAGGATASVVFPAGTTTRTVTLTPVDDAISEGNETFILTLANGTDYTHSSGTATITIADDDNALPVITEGAITTLTTNEDTAKNLTLNATDADTATTLTWSISAQGTKGIASTSGTGASQVITYTPTANANGTDTFVVQVSDGSATATITVNVTITAVNDAPVFVNFPTVNQNLSLGTAFSLQLVGADVENSAFTFSATHLPNWLNLSSAGVISGTPSIHEAGSRYAVTFLVSDGSAATQQKLNFFIENTSGAGALNTVIIRVLDVNAVKIVGAKVQIIGNPQTLFTNSIGEASFDVGTARDIITVKVSSNSHLGEEQIFSMASLANNTKVMVLSGDSIVISGNVISDGLPLVSATVVAHHSTKGSFSVFTDTTGAYTLNIPTPSVVESWEIGASQEGYSLSAKTLSLTSGSVHTENFSLTKSSKLSWSSFEFNGQKDVRLIKIKAQPTFQALTDFGSVQFIARTGFENKGDFGAVSYDSKTKTLNFNYNRGGTESKAFVEFTATPTGGTEVKVLIRLEFSDVITESTPIVASYFIDRVRSTVGGFAEETIVENGVQVTDYAGFEVPAFGVSANVEMIRIERKDIKLNVSGVKAQGKVYRIDAIGIENNIETTLGSENVTEILLTFPYDPALWSPTGDGKLFYSDDEGVTWLEHNLTNLVYMDTVKNTITVRSTHLSFWTLGTSGEESFGNSGSGGCFLKSSGQK